MQLALIESARHAAPRTATPSTAMTRTAAARPSTPLPESARQLPPPSLVAPMRGGLKRIDPGFNRQVAGAQQALQFLGQADSQLQELKAALSSRLSMRQSSVASEGSNAAVEQQLRRFDDLWRERATATAGTLDNQLGYRASGEARQAFSVRGLQMSSLRTGDRERLNFAVGGRAQRAVAVAIEPGLTDEALVQRFDRALAPSGIRAMRDARGELSFSVPESAWSSVRDTLAIKGEGRRFPTGQFSQVRVIPEESAIRPQDWNVTDKVTTRRTLQHVVTAQDAVRHARQGVDRVLADASSRLQPQSPQDDAKADADWSAAFTKTFEATANRGDYLALSALTPALLGINRSRVMALLGSAG